MMMSREIKFRAWDKTNNRWYDRRPHIAADITFDENGCLVEGFWDDNGELRTFHPDIEVVFMQFTGLHDKNGKEIYEGDLVRYCGWNHLLVVQWDHEEAGFIMGGRSWRRFGDGETSSELEVVGNIYENPELLQSDGGAR